MLVPTRKSVILVSGGLDSLLVTNLIEADVHLFVDYGQPQADLEHQAVLDLFARLGKLKVVKVNGMPEPDGVFIPARNLFLASIAVRFGEMIYMGGMKDDNVVDKTPDAFLAMSQLLTAQTKKDIEVISPFWETNKADALTEYLLDGGDRDKVQQTISCYRDGGEPCWDCEACFRWCVALLVNDFKVPIPSDRIIKEYLKKLHTYSKHRQWTTIKAIGTRKVVIECDIDGILTEETEGFDYLTRSPNPEAISRLNRNYDDGAWILLHTSRREIDRKITEDWLEQFGVKYHGLLMEKLPSHLRFDDQTERSMG